MSAEWEYFTAHLPEACKAWPMDAEMEQFVRARVEAQGAARTLEELQSFVAEREIFAGLDSIAEGFEQAGFSRQQAKRYTVAKVQQIIREGAN